MRGGVEGNLGTLGPHGRILYYSTVDEFDAFLAGDLELDELRRRARKREDRGLEPVEPPGGSVQSRLARWSA